ncbi:hypothetical protein DFH06DRAFT_567288 [Mycena polygramma]|nr:hypothetical protein DFH06DRAFT_567288 [Mycena polygramma]
MSALEQLEELDSCTTPALTLPNEITSEIFLHFLPVFPRCPPLIGPLSPTSLTHICRIWREIALTTPALWRAIPFSTDTRIPFARRLEMFNLWLSRSRHCYLSIELVIRDAAFFEADFSSPTRIKYNPYEDDNRYYVLPNVAAAISAAVLHSARWEYLKLHASTNIFPSIEAAMPLLRRLDLNLHNHSYAAKIMAFQDLPLLRTVILDLNYNSAWSIQLPFAHLTSLSLIHALTTACPHFLHQTPNLVHCELDLYSVYDDQPIDIRLPLLESLTLTRNDNRPPPAWYLGTFIVPALRNLRVPESFLGANPLETLGSFISKSGCKLQHVCITGSSISESSYCRAFPWIQTVRAILPQD